MPSTTVTAQLTDNYGLIWANAKIQISFQPNPGQPGPYCFDGDCTTGWQNVLSFIADINGNFSVILPANTSISPAGSMWRFAISPNADAPSVVLTLPINGITQDISVQFKSATTAYITQSLAVPRSYAAFTFSEPPDDGQLFFDTSNQQFYYWSNSQWNLLVATAPPETGFVQLNPPGAQTIVQPPNTNFTVNVTGTGLFVANGTILIGNGAIRIGGRNGVPPWDTGTPNINSDGSSVIINSAGAGGIFLTYDQGTGGTLFGNGAGSVVASVNRFGVVTAPNFLSGTSDTTYQFHASAAGHAQIALETTADNNAAVAHFTTPSQGWTIECAGISAAVPHPGDFSIFDTTAGLELFVIQRQTGNTATIGNFFANSVQTNPNGLTVGVAGPPKFQAAVLSNGIGGFETYLDTYGQDTATNGEFFFRSFRSDGSNELVLFHLDKTGEALFGFSVNIAGGLVVDGDFSIGGSIEYNGIIVQTLDGLDINTAPLEINMLSGIGGVIFGNGNGTQVGSIDPTGNIAFNGNAHFGGTLTAGLKNFKIPYPLDRAKTLLHSCLEGPEHAVFYRGEVTITQGEIEIILPIYFESLVMLSGRTVQLTQIWDEEFPVPTQLMATPVKDGKFKIIPNFSRAKVYWEVKAIRADVPELTVVN